MRPKSSVVAGMVWITLAAAGCAATVSADAYGPDLVTVSPGVQVVADYDVPIFYADGIYWRYDGGVWYRSGRYTGGWVHATPPVAVLRVDRPAAYAHYRPVGWAGRSGRAVPPRAEGGWRRGPSAAPAESGGWRGNQARSAPARPGPAVQPQPARPAAQPARPAAPRAAPQRPRGNGWRQ